MDGGSSEKLPEMEKCGSLIFGSSQLKLKMPFELIYNSGYKAPDAAEHVAEHILNAVQEFRRSLWIALKAVEMPVCMAFTTPMTTLLMPFQTVVKTVRIALKTVLVTVWMVFHAVVINYLNRADHCVTTAFMAFQIVVATTLIAVRTVVMIVL